MKKAKFWFKNEKEVMKALGFEPVKGSGSGWIHKEDGESEVALAQLKSTEAESYKVNYLDVQKLEYHAAVAHKIPVFVIEFLNRGTYLMINANDLDRIEELRTGKRKSDSMVVEENDLPEKAVVVKSSGQDRKAFYKEREKQWNRQKRKR